MRIHMSELGNADVLAGFINGRKVLAKLLERTDKEPTVPEPLFLDFAGVTVATASFLRETVLTYRDTVRRRRSNLYPVVANANQVVEDELKVLVGSADVLMLCLLDEKDQPHQPRLLGKLDPKQRLTFDLVQKRQETDAAELMREHRDETKAVKQTAWNNRLSALANMGLVVELSEGRAKRYRSLLAGATYGT